MDEYGPKYAVPHPDIKFPIPVAKKDPNIKINALCWHGKDVWLSFHLSIYLSIYPYLNLSIDLHLPF